MKHRIYMIAAIALAAALADGYGLYSIGLQHGMQAATVASAAPGGASQTNGAAPPGPGTDKKPLYWYDPMYPTQKFDKPGKSPFMDMELVPVYDKNAGENSGDASGVAINSRMQQNLGMRTAEATIGNLASDLSAVGSVAYNERDVALVQARANAYVERLYVRAPLDPVKKGQALLDLYVPDWIAAQEEFLSAKRMQGAGMVDVIDAARQRMRLAGMADEQVRLVETSGKVHPRLTITAPAGGVVTELAARAGMTVAPGATLFRINGVDPAWVVAEIPESAAARVRPGAGVEVRAQALPGSTFKGKVGALLPEVNAATRTIKARIELPNPSGQLVPGMFVTVNFAEAAGKAALLVPSEALIRTGTRSVVMLAREDGSFLPVEVETGTEAGGRTEIRNGLQAGQKVVVSGQFLIDSEASIRGTAARAGDAPAALDKAGKPDNAGPAAGAGK
ncbi:MAG: efflux RND transporter periplasmic adaptor subunit [Pseudomonadota bacterium]